MSHPGRPGLSVARRLVNRFVFPAEHPFSSLTIYYAVMVGVAALVIRLVPAAEAAVSGQRLAELVGGGLFEPAAGQSAAAASRLSWSTTLDMGLAMVGAALLMLPTSWVYMAERRRKGFDQGMVQTMIVLAVAISGVVVIVRNSVALAFSLTGIVAAVRFRTTLSDTRDTLYIFTSVGVGLAAGVQALAAALVLSAIFNYLVLLFWRADYAMCELGRSPGHLLVAPSTVASDGAKPKKKSKKKDYDAVLLVRALDADGAQPLVDGLLGAEVSRFKLAEVEANSRGQGVLKYLIRLGKGTNPRYLEDALLTRGAPNVIGARVH